MKNLILAMMAAAVSLTLVLVVIPVRPSLPSRVGPGHDPGALAPSRVPVLAGVAGAHEAVLRPRYEDEGRWRFTDKKLAHSLGLPEDRYAFYELIVINGGDGPLRVNVGDLVVHGPSGSMTRALDLNILAQHRPEAAWILASFAPRGDLPLEAGRSRRVVFAFPRKLDFENVESGRLGPLDLRPGRASLATLESWLLAREPSPHLVERLLADAEPDATDGEEPR
jgi:hypothetical protein